MIKDRNVADDANIGMHKIAGGGLLPVAETYYVDRNAGDSGDGKSLLEAKLTWGEAIALVNADYTAAASNGKSRGRMRRIIVMEGWYSEIPLTLSANDVEIVGVAPGHHDSIVLYGSATAGGYDITSTGPALKLTGSNNTISDVGAFTYDALYPAISNGAASVAVYGNKFLRVNFVRDVADGCDGGIADYGADGTEIAGCFFSTSQATYGIKCLSNGVINPVNPWYHHNRMIGIPTGILQTAGHNSMSWNNWFSDDTSDRADTSDTPIVINATSGAAWENYAQGVSSANVVTGTGTISELRNWGDS